MGFGWLFSGMVYGDLWRERRRMFRNYFHSKNTQFFHPIQVEFIRKMLPLLLETPGEFLSAVRQ